MSANWRQSATLYACASPAPDSRPRPETGRAVCLETWSGFRMPERSVADGDQAASALRLATMRLGVQAGALCAIRHNPRVSWETSHAGFRLVAKRLACSGHCDVHPGLPGLVCDGLHLTLTEAPRALEGRDITSVRHEWIFDQTAILFCDHLHSTQTIA